MIVTWVKDEVAFRKWVADRYETFPIRPEDMNANYDAMDANRFFPMTAFDESGVVGHLILRYVDDGMTTIRFGFIIVDDAKRGKGYGKRMIELATEFAFAMLGAQKITLGVFANNESAHRCYLAAGFRDLPVECAGTYKVFGEDWVCLEMEMHQA
jgi:RimJ/RimL family protein N-acetyltransferase